jgi:hypothetical protein
MAETQEPKIKWRDSKAKGLLYQDLLNGTVPIKARDEQNKKTANLIDIYNMRPEYKEYSYKKFSARLSSTRKSVAETQKRSDSDRIALIKYIENHPVSTSSHKGYAEWQDNIAQSVLLEDIENNLHITLGREELYRLRPEYYEEYPYSVFRDKLKQELRTAKYYHTLRVKGKLHKSS